MERLSYTAFDSPVGWICVVTSSRGVCALDFCGDNPPDKYRIEKIVSQLGAEVDNLDPSLLSFLQKAKDAVLDYLNKRAPIDATVPVDLSAGTPFQQRVWSVLREIPFGETRSYSEVAASIGKALAGRAVGQACGRNPVAILVPCHRVVGRSGKLTGFSGGIHIKEMLLNLERNACKH